MEIKELFNVMEYGLNFYKDEQLNNRFNLMEYYSLTDLNPNVFYILARKHKRNTLATAIIQFKEDRFWLLQDVKPAICLENYHEVSGHVLTDDEKLTIIEKLKSEGLPLIEGVYKYAARQFVKLGVDEISKEKTRNKIIKAYNEYYDNQPEKQVKPKVLSK